MNASSEPATSSASHDCSPFADTPCFPDVCEYPWDGHYDLIPCRLAGRAGGSFACVSYVPVRTALFALSMLAVLIVWALGMRSLRLLWQLYGQQQASEGGTHWTEHLGLIYQALFTFFITPLAFALCVVKISLEEEAVGVAPTATALYSSFRFLVPWTATIQLCDSVNFAVRRLPGNIAVDMTGARRACRSFRRAIIVPHVILSSGSLLPLVTMLANVFACNNDLVFWVGYFGLLGSEAVSMLLISTLAAVLLSRLIGALDGVLDELASRGPVPLALHVDPMLEHVVELKRRKAILSSLWKQCVYSTLAYVLVDLAFGAFSPLWPQAYILILLHVWCTVPTGVYSSTQLYRPGAYLAISPAK